MAQGAQQQQAMAEDVSPLPALLLGSSERSVDLGLKAKAQVDATSIVVPETRRPRAVVASISPRGHLRLAMAVAAELSRRGFAVDFAMAAAGVPRELEVLEQEHEHFTIRPICEGQEISLDWERVAASTGRLGGSRVALMEQIADRCHSEQVRSDMLANMKSMTRLIEKLKPDLLVLDHALGTIQMWGEKQGIPSIIMHTPYFSTSKPKGCAKISLWQTFRLIKVIKQRNPFVFFTSVMEELGLAEEGGKLNLREGVDGVRESKGLSPHTLVFCEPELLNRSARALPERVHVVGPCLGRDVGTIDADLQPWLEAANEQGQRVLYVALGTLANGFLNLKAVTEMLLAFERLGSGWRVLWSLPEAQQTLLGQAGAANMLGPSKLLVKRFVNQRAVLNHRAVSLFLTHGGQSSTNEGIFAGVPLVCMPLFCDQFEVADAVERHCLGLVIHKDELLNRWFSGGKHLSRLLLRVAEEPRFRAAVKKHQHLMQLRAGCHRAGEVAECIVRAGADYQSLWQGYPQATAKRSGRTGCAAGLAACLRGWLPGRA